MHEENSKPEETSIIPAIPKHTCLLCNYQTNKKPLLKAHEKTHLKATDWQCTQCNYKSSREFNLKRHVKSIHENLRYYCDLCSYSTTRNNYLKDHINFIHKNNEKTL
jgi:uncharacterized Zn-finger protein